ncbi:MAG: Maf family protein [Alphaproteobacteria bacterium]|nr:Maf family protein [Alphaproteobacteria bacterium]
MSAGLTNPDGPGLWLASASPIRAEMLRRAGVAAGIEAAMIDEGEVKAALRAERAAASAVAETLAELKAVRVSRRHRGALVIGADQMLVCGEDWFDKPADTTAARAQLRALRGRKHELVSAVCVVRDGTRIWHHQDRASLWMRSFSDAFLDRYLDVAGEDCTGTVGAYRVEGPGVQLFSRIEGDHFTILGLPLLPLLDCLRQHDVVPT